MAATEAQQLIARLQARGWSYHQLGQLVGRDSSLLRQGALGKKPLRNLLSALRQIEATSQGPELVHTLGSLLVPRRQTRAGTPAAVRQRPERVGQGATPALHLATKHGNKSILRVLAQAAREGKQVAITGTYRHVRRAHKSGGGRGRPRKGKGRREPRAEVPLFQKGGYSAQALLDRITQPQPGDPWRAGDALKAIKELTRRMELIEQVGVLEQVEVYAYNLTPG